MDYILAFHGFQWLLTAFNGFNCLTMITIGIMIDKWWLVDDESTIQWLCRSSLGATGIPTYSHILTTQKWKALRSYTDRLSEHKKRAHHGVFCHGFYRFFSKSPGFPSAFHGFPHLMELHCSSAPLDETAHHRCDVPAAATVTVMGRS